MIPALNVLWKDVRIQAVVYCFILFMILLRFSTSQATYEKIPDN